MSSIRSALVKHLHPAYSRRSLRPFPLGCVRLNHTIQTPSAPSPLVQYPRAQELEIQDLIHAGLHQGHAQNRWTSVNLPYILGERHGLHVIDVTQTLSHLRRAAKFTELTASYGGLVLFVGSRPDLHGIVADVATYAQAYYVTHWLPGTLTNAHEVLHQKKGDKVVRPDVMVALDPAQGATQQAIREAQKCNIPTIAPIDTDMDPRLVTYPIPANDEGLRGLELIAQTLAQSALQGYHQYLAQQKLKQKKQIASEMYMETPPSERELDGWTDVRHL